MIYTFLDGTRISFEKREEVASGPARCCSCWKSVHGGNLTWRGPSSRLHQWHSSMWLSFLSGIPHSPNQSKQATLYLMIIPASVPISHVCVQPESRRKNKTNTDSLEPCECDPAEQLHSCPHWAILSQFTQLWKNRKFLWAIRSYWMTDFLFIFFTWLVKRWFVKYVVTAAAFNARSDYKHLVFDVIYYPCMSHRWVGWCLRPQQPEYEDNKGFISYILLKCNH